MKEYSPNIIAAKQQR